MGVSGNTCAASCKISYMAGVDSILWVFFVRSHVTPPFYVLETLYVSAFALLECISAKCISSRTRHNIYLYFPESHLLPGRQCEGVLSARGRRKLSGWRQATWDLFVWPLFWGLGCKFRPRASHPVWMKTCTARRACSPWGAALLVLRTLNCHFSRLFRIFFARRPVIFWGARAQVASAPWH